MVFVILHEYIHIYINVPYSVSFLFCSCVDCGVRVMVSSRFGVSISCIFLHFFVSDVH